MIAEESQKYQLITHGNTDNETLLANFILVGRHIISKELLIISSRNFLNLVE